MADKSKSFSRQILDAALVKPQEPRKTRGGKMSSDLLAMVSRRSRSPGSPRKKLATNTRVVLLNRHEPAVPGGYYRYTMKGAFDDMPVPLDVLLDQHADKAQKAVLRYDDANDVTFHVAEVVAEDVIA